MRKIVLTVIVASWVFLTNAQVHKYDFGAGPVQKGYLQVTSASVYDSVRGYGFEPGVSLKEYRQRTSDAVRSDYITADQPFFFSVKLPEGNYNVKVIIAGDKGASLTTIKAECRRLMVESLKTEKNKYTEALFTVHIRDSLITGGTRVRLKPREKTYNHWDNKLTLEFNGQQPKICAVEITPARTVPTVFLAGNSTVVDQAEEPWAAWGQMVPVFFQGGKVAIGNYAESGETLKAFKGARRLEKIWSMSKPGDYLFIEFAHNDQKAGGNHLDPFTTYKQTVKEWIADARKRGVNPVLLTSMHRRNFDSAGKIINTLGDYPEAIRQTGREEGVPVIDLNAMSKVLYETWGPEASIKAFVHFPANSFPNQPNELKDNTHFSTYGAYELAKCVVTGIRQQVPALAAFLKENLPAFDPAKPAPYTTWKLPSSPLTATKKPDGN